ncbi:hypothetical protein [Corynebacterium sp. LK2510]|uniref:hypothetical protein n=1 Tax=Corynebacterium sp. LK2510 TaxID=3110472 RepID=UPI0034CEAA53
MHVFTFAVSEGTVVDAPAYLRALRELGVSSADLNRLRVDLAVVSGTRKAIVEVGHGVVSLTLRPLAPLPDEVVLSATAVRDQRTHPEVCGPDLGWQRSCLAALGTHEGLLIDASSRIPQAIAAPLLTISTGESPVVTVSGHPRTTPSIALDGVVDVLREAGAVVTDAPRGFRVYDLMHAETWLIDPVHGARLVTTWREYGVDVPGRIALNRGGLPTHREINKMRWARAQAI